MLSVCRGLQFFLCHDPILFFNQCIKKNRICTALFHFHGGGLISAWFSRVSDLVIIHITPVSLFKLSIHICVYTNYWDIFLIRQEFI